MRPGGKGGLCMELERLATKLTAQRRTIVTFVKVDNDVFVPACVRVMRTDSQCSMFNVQWIGWCTAMDSFTPNVLSKMIHAKYLSAVSLQMESVDL